MNILTFMHLKHKHDLAVISSCSEGTSCFVTELCKVTQALLDNNTMTVLQREK